MKPKKLKLCENCNWWGSITWKCVHPKGHRNNETVQPEDTCEYFELDMEVFK